MTISSEADDPRGLATLERIRQLRSQMRLHDARPNDGRCGAVSRALASEFGWRQECGYLRLLDDTVSWVHCWNRLDSGTIVDATADQFQDLWLAGSELGAFGIVVIDPTDPRATNYRSAPQEWSVHVVGDATGGHVECRSAERTRTLHPDDVDHPWCSLARQTLEVITGWAPADDLVDLAARALRARAGCSDPFTSEEFTHILLIASVQHLGKRGDEPWIAPEFGDPL